MRECGERPIPGRIGTRILAAILRLAPKVGPFKGLGFNNPTPHTEDLYIKSINKTTDSYKALLQQVRAGSLVLPNCNLDDGSRTSAGEYSIADDTYASLLAELSAGSFNLTSSPLRANILGFYSDLSLPIETKKDAKQWQAVLSNLDQLKAEPQAR